MITINNETFLMIKELLNYQKALREELDDNYVNGFHDGMEVVVAAVEGRLPNDLTQVKSEEGLVN